MTNVFISYSSSDSDFAELAMLKLRDKGIKVWLDKGELHPGDDWRDEIDEGISSSDVLIVVLSERSSASAYVTFEWAYALGRGAKVIPILIQKAPTHPRLEAIQYLDFTNPQVRPWDKLIEEILRASSSITIQGKHQETEVFYSLAVSSFIDKLTLRFRTIHLVGFGSTMPFFDEDKATVRSVNAFGEMVKYDTTKSGGEAETELQSLVKRIAVLRRERERKLSETLLRLFSEVQGSSQFITHQLSKVRFGTTTLDGPWSVAQEAVSQLWQQKSKDLSYFELRELDRVQEFLQQHPLYQSVYAKLGQEIESFLLQGHLKLDELIDLTRIELEKSLKKYVDEQNAV